MASFAVPSVHLSRLEGFFHVGERGGFARAVEVFPYPITESALHQQVRKLERALGVELIVRGPGRRMVLTPAGRVLHSFVRPFFEGLPGVLRSVARGEAEELGIATEPLYVDGLCAGVLARLRRSLPRAQFRLVEADLPHLAHRILDGREDLGIAGVDRPHPGLAFDRLGELGLELLVPGNHPLAGRRPPLSAGDLAPFRFTLYTPGSGSRDFTEEALRASGLAVSAAAQASSAPALRALVRAGLWPAFVPFLGGPRRRPARRRLPDGTVAFDLTELVREVAGRLPSFGVLRRASREPVNLARVFIAAARRALASSSRR